MATTSKTVETDPMLWGGLTGLVIALIAWVMRQGAMKKRLAAFDNGSMCINCRSRNMTTRDGMAHCGDCMHVADLGQLKAAVITDEQIAIATRPKSGSV